MATTQELGQAFDAAQAAHKAKQSAHDEYVRTRMNEERQRIGEAARLIYGDDLKSLREAADAAYSAHQAALDADARAGVGAEFTPGTIFEEWLAPRYSRWDSADRKKVKTGKRARYIARTNDTVLPNSQTYGQPKLGEYFLQVIKKDGTPGVAIVARRDWQSYYPEGVDANAPNARAAMKTWEQKMEEEQAERVKLAETQPNE